jgi:hypothetical protein
LSLFPWLFGFYWLSVLAWWGLERKLSAGLRRRHPLLYASLGRGALALLGFLLRRRDRFTGDAEIARLCGAMRTFLLFYALVFLSAPAFL